MKHSLLSYNPSRTQTDLMASPSFRFFGMVLLLLFLTSGTTRLWSQTEIIKIENDYVAAAVNTAQKAGRFWIEAGWKKNRHRFLFHGNKSVQQITSNVVFRVDWGTQTTYYTNNTPDFFLKGERPQYGSDTAIFLPYKSIRYNQDTIEMYYDQVGPYEVKMRLIVEDPISIYDNGADALIEFEYHIRNGASGGKLGIMLMLDGDNGAAYGFDCGSGDDASIATTSGYFDVNKPGYLFRPPFDSIPDFYHVGNFCYNPAYIAQNRILPIHRLRGKSSAGTPLTEPTQFGIGNWIYYRTLAWDPIAVSRVGDVATACQWENLAGNGIVRTAFGSNNEGSNNAFQCRDKRLFADIRTVRIIQETSDNGNYDYENFLVEMWISNTGEYDVIHGKVRLFKPIASFPDNTERITLDPSTPQDQDFILLPSFTKKLTWRLRVNKNSRDTLSKIEFLLKENGDTDFKQFLDGCTPLITIRPFRPPPTDTLPPVVKRTGSGRTNTAFWDYQTFDRHPSFDYDTGLEKIAVLTNDNNNFRMTRNPDPFTTCDVTTTVNMHFEVVDTSRAARIIFRVNDCKGNQTVDSILYSPKPDPFKPRVSMRDSSGSFDPVQWPCNARIRRVTMIDSLNQFPNRIDYGFGKMEVISSSNFTTPEITDARGATPGTINAFDPRFSFNLNVIDSLTDAQAEIKVTDYAGNDTTLFFSYCTINDYQKPKIYKTGSSATGWEVTATDSSEWDRGLLQVRILSTKNMRYIWPDGTRRDSLPALSKGSKVGKVQFELISQCDPGEVILEFRDLYADEDPANHISYDTVRYEGVPDIYAPNILIRPGYDGTTYYFDITVDDIHMISGQRFVCDRGLKNVSYTMTSNMRIRSPLVYTGIHEAKFSVEIIDTLAVDRTDTVCITAVDSVGNTTSDCQFWPTTPDAKSPIFNGRLDRSLKAIIGAASDDRANDRGLASVFVRRALNVSTNPSLVTLNGSSATPVSIGLTTVEDEIAGEIVVQDLYGQLLNTPESSIHTVVIPFRLPIVNLLIEMPDIVETGVDFTVPITALSPIASTDISEFSFTLQLSGPARFLGVTQSGLVNGLMAVTPLGNDLYEVHYKPAVGETIPASTTVAYLRFLGDGISSQVLPVRLMPVETSYLVNDGEERIISVLKNPSDNVPSTLILPSPLLRLTGDTITYINGDCNRALTSDGLSKPHGLAILSIEPHPVESGRTELGLVIRDLTEEGASIEWMASDGRSVAEQRIVGTGIDVERLKMAIPSGLPAGLYYIRINGPNGVDTKKVILLP